MNVEHVAGIGLAAGRLTGEQRDLAMGGGVLGQIVDDDQRVLAAIAKILRDGEARERRDPLQPGRTRGPGDDDDAAAGFAVSLDRFDGAPDARSLLADRHIDADDVARSLIDDRVDGDRGLADRAIADDEFALAAAEREQRVDDDEAGLHRLGHQIAFEDSRRRPLDRLVQLGFDRPAAVDRAAERIDDAPEQRRADWHAHDVAGPAHDVAGFDGVDVVEQHAADAVAFERLGETELSLVEAQQLVEPDVGKSGDERDAVLDLLDAPDLLHPRAELGGAERGAGALEPGVRGSVNVLRHVRCPRECD